MFSNKSNIMMKNGGDQLYNRNSIQNYPQVLIDLFHGSGNHPKTLNKHLLVHSLSSPIDSKMSSLEQIYQTLIYEKEQGNNSFVSDIISHKEKTEDLFYGLSTCIASSNLYQLSSGESQSIDKSQVSSGTSDKVIEVILKANSVLFELMAEVQAYAELEKSMVQLIPIFIENLGSPKAIVRKSTHKCIGTYVKLTKKLELVIHHIIRTGLENQNSRTRQHSMLVIPALISLKTSLMETENQQIQELVIAVIRRIQSDSSEIVQKTGKKLLLELQKCYPNDFQKCQVDTIPQNDNRLICLAVLENNDDKLKEMIVAQKERKMVTPQREENNTVALETQKQRQPEKQIQQQKQVVEPPVKKKASLRPQEILTKRIQLQQPEQIQQQSSSSPPPVKQNDLKNAGREIMSNKFSISPPNPPKIVQQPSISHTEESPLPKELSKTQKQQAPITPVRIINEPAQNNSPHPRSDNGLLYGFLQDQQIEDLDENNQWKERTQAFEKIELDLNQVLSTSNKIEVFHPYCTPFLGFIIEYIKDINFKISLTAIQITRKLLVLNIQSFNKHKTQLTTTLIEKLSDSKVVIRQAVLKCCGFIIANSQYGMMALAYHSIGYLQHTNWQVREGILHLLANCLLAQGQMDELNDPNSQDIDPNHFAFNQHFISELCALAKMESKSKIQQMVVDCLALCLELSPQKTKTEQLMIKELNVLSSETLHKGILIQIKERKNKDYLPSMQIDGTIEFKPSGIMSDILPYSPKKIENVQFTPDKQKDGSELQMRFQQQRITNNQSHHNQNVQSQRVQNHNQFLDQPITQEIKQEQIPIKTKQEVEKSQNQNLFEGQAPVQLRQDQMQNRQQFSKSAINKKESQNLQSLREQPIINSQAKILQTPNVVADKQIKGANNKDLTPIKYSMTSTKQQNNNQHEQIGSGIQQKPIEENPKINDNKISMWLPSFKEEKELKKEQPEQSPYQIQKQIQKAQIQEQSKVASESASNFVDDGRSFKTSPSTHVSTQPQTRMANKFLNQKKQQSALTNTISQIPSEISNSTVNRPKQNNEQVKMPVKLPLRHDKDMSVQEVTQGVGGYTPSNHNSKPRQIYSNELRQRTLDNELLATNKKLQHMANTNANNDFLSLQQQSPRGDHDQKQLTGQIGRIDHGNTDMKIAKRNMSQSSGAPGGFKMDKTQINQKLALLKSTFKYKNTSEIDNNNEDIKMFDVPGQTLQTFTAKKAESEHNARGRSQKYSMNNFVNMPNIVDDSPPQLFVNPQMTTNSFAMGEQKQMSMPQPQRTQDSFGINSRGESGKIGNLNAYKNKRTNQGPIRATAMPKTDFLQTIQIDEHKPTAKIAPEEVSNLTIKQQKSAPFSVKKPPVATKLQHQQDQYDYPSPIPTEPKRMSSQNYNCQPKPYQKQPQMNATAMTQMITAQDAYPNNTDIPATTTYNASEEPLRNPELQFKQCIENFKLDNWQNVFDSLNVLKRVAMFHKELLSCTAGLTVKECIKGLVKQTDNLRSQVAKNACMTIQVIFQELPTKDLDPHVDLVLAALIKKATDTNKFVSEQAEKSLAMVCHACTEAKVFNSLQAIPSKSNNLKLKICICYSNVISKLGPKIKTFRDIDRLMRTIVLMLSEQAQEVRNAGKLAILTIKNNLQNGRELDSMLLRCGLTDKQIDQARKVIEQGDYEVISNFAGITQYGGSMRGSSLDSRGAADGTRRQIANNRNQAAGSDGFTNISQFSDNNMQQTFMSNNNFGATGSSQNAFKKRQQSMSKPVDPQLMENFKTLVNSVNTNDWSERLQAVDNLSRWIEQHSITVKQAQQSKFIQLVDSFCKLIQDNNVKVQGKALQNFQGFLQNDNLRLLIDQNLSMIVQALAHNFASSNPSIRNQSESLFIDLEDTTINPNQLVQPIVAQLNLSNNRNKPALVERLACMLNKLDNLSIIEKYVSPLIKPSSKIQQESAHNPKLREALKLLEQNLQMKQ